VWKARACPGFFAFGSVDADPACIGKNLLFLKKKKQKDFYPHGSGARGSTEFRAELTKVFCFFSSEKKVFSKFLVRA